MLKIPSSVAGSVAEFNAKAALGPPKYYADIRRMGREAEREEGKTVPEPAPINAAQQQELVSLYREVQGDQLRAADLEGVDTDTANSLIARLKSKQEYLAQHPELLNQS